jgi:hypothetical protein
MIFWKKDTCLVETVKETYSFQLSTKSTSMKGNQGLFSGISACITQKKTQKPRTNAFIPSVLSCLEDDLPTPADISVVYFRDHFDVLELAARAENSPNAEVDQNPSKSAQQSQNEKSERSIPASSLFGDEDLLQVLEKFPKVFHVLKPGVKVFTFCHSSKIQDGLPLPLRTKDNLPIRIGKSTKCSGIWGSTNVQSEKDKIVHSNPFLGNPDRKDINSQEFIPKMTEYETQGNPILLCLHGEGIGSDSH